MYIADTSLPPRIQVRRALRSGAFKQGRAALQNDAGYCCLGVACVIAEQNGVKVARNSAGTLFGDSLVYGQPDVLAWLDMSAREQAARIGWNDDESRTFAEIAKVF